MQKAVDSKEGQLLMMRKIQERLIRMERKATSKLIAKGNYPHHCFGYKAVLICMEFSVNEEASMRWTTFLRCYLSCTNCIIVGIYWLASLLKSIGSKLHVLPFCCPWDGSHTLFFITIGFCYDHFAHATGGIRLINSTACWCQTSHNRAYSST